MAASTNTQSPSLIVYYNTRCPVCDYGIRRQKARLLEAVKAGEIEFRDINLEPQALAHWGAGVEDVRKRLHALDGAGELLVGADVAIAIWRRTPGERWLGAIMGSRPLAPVARLTYDLFARALYAWNRRKGHW
ncbi:MAG: thiol-disulfide oxidoreductase DCC family protein [Beijerinckiaceae bacterium]